MAEKYVVKKDQEELRATEAGFYRAERIRAGGTFFAEKGEVFSWARPKDETVAEAKKNGLLDKPLKDILPALKGLSDASLRALRDEEASNTNRKTVINAIEDEEAERIGKIDPLK